MSSLQFQEGRERGKGHQKKAALSFLSRVISSFHRRGGGRRKKNGAGETGKDHPGFGRFQRGRKEATRGFFGKEKEEKKKGRNAQGKGSNTGDARSAREGRKGAGVPCPPLRDKKKKSTKALGGEKRGGMDNTHESRKEEGGRKQGSSRGGGGGGGGS